MDRRVIIGGGVVAVALILLGVRLASNSGAKSGLDAALAHLPPGFTATHGAVTYNALTGEANVRDLAISHNGAPVFAAGTVTVSGIGAQDATGTPRRIGEIVLHDAAAGPYKHIARADLTGIYPATLREVFDVAAYPGGKPAWTDKRLVLEHGEAHGIEGAQTGIKTAKGGLADATFTLSTMTVDGLRFSQLPAPPDPAAPPMNVVIAIEASMAEESSAMKDLAFAVKSDQFAMRGTLGRSSATKYDGGRLGDISMANLTVRTDNPAGITTLDGASGHGFDMSKMLALWPVLAADPGKPHPELLNGFHLGNGEMHGLRVDYAQGPLVTMDKMSVHTAPAGAVNGGKFTIDALTIKTSGRPLSPSARAQLDSFGMADFTTDLDEEGGYDANAGQLTLKRLDLVFHDLGTLHTTLNVNGLPPTQAATPEEIQAAAASARLTDASLVWDDHSLTSRLLKMTAAKQGVTPDQVRMGLALPLASLAVLMPEQPDAVTQVNAFLAGQHRLALIAKPPEPVGVAQWQATPVPQRAALLGLRVTGN